MNSNKGKDNLPYLDRIYTRIGTVPDKANIAAREEAAITQHRKETSDENKQFDPGG